MSCIITLMSQLSMSDHTTMGSPRDTFLTLPVEIRIEILSYLGTRRNLAPITAASPCMLDTYIENEMYIRRTFYKKTFTDRMMQDALAFITFPPNTYGNLNIEHPVMQSYKSRWISGEFPCPFNTTRRNDIDDLDSLYHRLDNRIPKYWIGLPNNPDGPVNWVARSNIETQRHLQRLLKAEILKEWWYNIFAWVLNGAAILMDMEKAVYDTSN